MSHTDGTVAAAAAHPPAPAAQKLHRHALECIFAFCRRADLVAVSAVSRNWQAATLSMAPLRWRVSFDDVDWLEELCRSPLRRHIAYLDCFDDRDIAVRPDCLKLLSQCLPHLRTLSITVRLPLPAGFALQFPARLRWLVLTLEFLSTKDGDEGAVQTASFNAALDAVTGLAQLELLTLHVSSPMSKWVIPGSLAALARAPCLRSLNLALTRSGLPRLSDERVAELRALTQLQTLSFNKVDTPLLRRLLAPPHSLQWQELGSLWLLTEDDAALLVTLPLRTLHAKLSMPHADFLLQLPQLQSLTLCVDNRGPRDAERILQAVGGCAQLRELTLQDGDI